MVDKVNAVTNKGGHSIKQFGICRLVLTTPNDKHQTILQMPLPY